VAAGINDYILKPLQPQTLKDKIDRLMAMKRA
jgi:YesN/AraC family two-component response regulator